MKNSICVIVVTLLLSVTGNSQPRISHFSLEYRGPVAYSDRPTQTIFYAESDGHHLSAISFDGKVFWTRDLYADTERMLKELSKHNAPGDSPMEQMLREERNRRKIVSIGRAAAPNGSGKGNDQKMVYLSIWFSSADFGIIEASTGNLVQLGRD